MAQVTDRMRFRASLSVLGVAFAIAVIVTISLWLLVFPWADVEAQVQTGPSVSRSSPSGLTVALQPGASQQFTVSAAAGSNDISSWEWSVNGSSQGNESLTPTQSVSRTFSHTFSSAGSYTVRATFTDTASRSGSTTWRVGVSSQAAQAPTVTRNSPSSSVVPLITGESQTFSVTATDANSDIYDWEWTVNGDSQLSERLSLTGSTTKTFSHTFSSAGTYTVEAEFIDFLSRSDSVSWGVEVSDAADNSPPFASRIQPEAATLSLNVGERYPFIGDCSDSDRGRALRLARADWSVNDTVVASDEFDFLPTYIIDDHTVTFPTAGTHTVTLTCYDRLGASGSVSWTVRVAGATSSNRAPSIFSHSPSSPVSLTAGEIERFTAAATDPDSNITRWRWYLDGALQGDFAFQPQRLVERVIIHSFPDTGNYTVRSTFTDAGGRSASVSWEVQVAATPSGSGDCLEDMGTLAGQVARTGQWSSDCESVARDGSYARFYTFTLDEEREVTITLESGDTNTYLYLREGNARSGAALNDHGADDDAGNGTNSQAVETLSAGTYTVEATTFDGEETGDFALSITPAGAESGDCLEDLGTLAGQVSRTGEWSSDCESVARDDSYARFYSFTLAEATEVTIDLESGDTDTYLYLRDGSAQSGTALNDHEDDDDAGEGTNSQAVETLAAGTYTIEATTYDEEETGDFTLTITPAGAATTPESLGSAWRIWGELTAQVVRVPGSGASDCASSEQDDTYARFYSFTLADETEVTIDLESGDTDTYLYLREGNARSGASLNDHGV